MGRSLQIMIFTITLIAPAAFADDTAACAAGYGNRASECAARDTERDDTAEALGRAVRKAGECTRIEKLLTNRKMRELMMQEPEGKRMVGWYAGNCPLGKVKG